MTAYYTSLHSWVAIIIQERQLVLSTLAFEQFCQVADQLGVAWLQDGEWVSDIADLDAYHNDYVELLLEYTLSSN